MQVLPSWKRPIQYRTKFCWYSRGARKTQSAPNSAVVECDPIVNRERCLNEHERSIAERLDRRRWRRRRRREQDDEVVLHTIVAYSGASCRLLKKGLLQSPRGRRALDTRQAFSRLSGVPSESRHWKEVYRCRKRIAGSRRLQRLVPTAEPSGLQSRIQLIKPF
jgi:hypothetical protein